MQKGKFHCTPLQMEGPQLVSQAFHMPTGTDYASKIHKMNTVVSAAAAAKSLQSCPTLCNPRDGSPPGSPVPGILQARTLEWVAISFSNAWKWKVKVKWLSHVRLLATPWIAAYQAPPSMGFSRQECWSGVPLPSPQYSLVLPYSPLYHLMNAAPSRYTCMNPYRARTHSSF